jgi:hypothetical protein
MSAVEFDTGREHVTYEQAIDRFQIGDILMHTWDVARAAGLDERLDPDEVHRIFVTMGPFDEIMRTSGFFGAKVAVPDDADEQARVIAFSGRDPRPVAG